MSDNITEAPDDVLAHELLAATYRRDAVSATIKMIEREQERRRMKIRVEKDWLSFANPLRPNWNVRVGDITLASFLGWYDAIRYAMTVAGRVQRKWAEGVPDTRSNT